MDDKQTEETSQNPDAMESDSDSDDDSNTSDNDEASTL